MQSPAEFADAHIFAALKSPIQQTGEKIVIIDRFAKPANTTQRADAFAIFVVINNHLEIEIDLSCCVGQHTWGWSSRPPALASGLG